MSLASPKSFFGDSSHWASRAILDLRFPWFGVCRVWNASEGPLNDALGYGAGLAWPQPVFAHCLVVRGKSRRQDKIVDVCPGQDSFCQLLTLGSWDYSEPQFPPL